MRACLEAQIRQCRQNLNEIAACLRGRRQIGIRSGARMSALLGAANEKLATAAVMESWKDGEPCVLLDQDGAAS